MSKKENPFDLTKLLGEFKPSAPFTYQSSGGAYSDSQIKDLLENYKEVPGEDRGSMITGIHVRYRKNDGSFKRGGYVVRNYVSNKEGSKGAQMLRLKSSLGSNAKEWSVNLANVQDLWETTKFQPKPTVETVAGGMKQTTDGLKNRVEQLSIEVSHLANEQKRIIALIKKLHHINI